MVILGQDEAQRLGHRHVGTEHLLLGILADGDSVAAEALVASGATLAGARQKVIEAVPAATGGASDGELPFTDRAKRVLDRAARLSLRHQEDHVRTEHVLLSLLDVEGTAGQVLRGLGVDLARLRGTLDSTIDQPGATAGAPEGAAPAPRCGSCGAGLEGGLSHRVMPSRDDAGKTRELLVAFCTSCGTVIGAGPASGRVTGSK